MQTSLPQDLLATPAGAHADEILRSCVHCGFCNATCPTYLLTGDELDGPRGRIYLIKQMMEGKNVSATTSLHLDRCLTCRACETTCPSGVQYRHLLDTGREIIENRLQRPLLQRLTRKALAFVLPRTRLFTLLLRMGQLIRPLAFPSLKKSIPAYRTPQKFFSTSTHARQMILLDGCVQPALAPDINTATRRVLDRLGITVIVPKISACCGGVNYHLTQTDAALQQMRNNIDAWWPAIEAGAEAIVITASGCAPTVKDYGRLLINDIDYAARAKRVSELAKDISEIIAAETLPENNHTMTAKIAFHSPCTLQHGQGITGIVEQLLTDAGYTLTPVADGHLCCGSAGTYSITQPTLSRQLRDNKLACLEASEPDVIVTANIGCLSHMANHATVPVKHWIELLSETL